VHPRSNQYPHFCDGHSFVFPYCHYHLCMHSSIINYLIMLVLKFFLNETIRCALFCSFYLYSCIMMCIAVVCSFSVLYIVYFLIIFLRIYSWYGMGIYLATLPKPVINPNNKSIVWGLFIFIIIDTIYK
jgi:hypothetical protein